MARTNPRFTSRWRMLYSGYQPYMGRQDEIDVASQRSRIRRAPTAVALP